MRDQEMVKDPPVSDRMARNAGQIEIEQTIAAVIAKTRQEWTLRGPACPSPAVPSGSPSRWVRPYFRLVSGAKDFAS